MFRHILVPVDFSILSALGLKYAGALARCTQARVTVLFADPFLPPAYFTRARAAELASQFREGVREAELQLREFVQAALGPEASAGVDAKVVEALPVDAIIAAAEAGAADLIVMGTHGRSGVNRIMLGSVAERVIRESRIPVLTVRGDAGEAPEIRNILVPMDGSGAARAALAVANDVAGCAGARVAEIRVEEPEADPAERIIARAMDLQCNLLVLGSRHRRFFDSTVLGATVARVVRHAPCPVLIVPEPEARAAQPGN